MAALTRRVFLQGEDDYWDFHHTVCVSCGHRDMRVATVGTDIPDGPEDERWAFDSLRGVRTAQEGALWRGAVQWLQHTHIHNPGSLCEYDVWTSYNMPWITTFLYFTILSETFVISQICRNDWFVSDIWRCLVNSLLACFRSAHPSNFLSALNYKQWKNKICKVTGAQWSWQSLAGGQFIG